ncbi:MAG: hypothetical protein LUQ06_05370 [Methylococcaceae bacterium]|jgi:hypothetical protein|nr:hypothetical protein [Methylococcaceae bacterium]
MRTNQLSRAKTMRLDEIIQQHTKTLSPAHQAEVFDFVLFLEQKQNNMQITDPQQQRKERLKKALDDAVALGVFAGVDGVAWQNEQRQDRNIGYDE